MVGTLVFLTPSGGLAILALALPLAGLAFAARREHHAREILGLRPPPPVRQAGRAVALAAVPLLLGLAATQPALRSTQNARIRTDAQAFFVLDISRSMLASAGRRSPTRLARARQDALTLRDAVPEVPAGIATMTDRVVPDLFPNPDRNVFVQTLTHAVGIEEPPPVSSNVLATSLDSLGSLGTQNFFDPGAKRRVVVVLTDGEGVAFDPASVARQLAAGPGVHLVLIHVWSANERVYDASGSFEQGYHTHPESAQAIASLAAAAGGRWFGGNAVGAAAQAVREAAGSGPTRVQGRTERTRTLAPYVALLALLPLLLVLPRVRSGLGSALRLFAETELRRAGARIRTRLPRRGPQKHASAEQGS